MMTIVATVSPGNISDTSTLGRDAGASPLFALVSEASRHEVRCLLLRKIMWNVFLYAYLDTLDRLRKPQPLEATCPGKKTSPRMSWRARRLR